MTFLHALGSILSLLLVALTGFILAARKFFPSSCVRLMPRFITNISLPPFLACTIVASFQQESLFHLVQGAIAPFIQMILLFSLAFGFGKLCQVPKRRFGLFCACVSNPNTIFIGIPVNMALFGEEAISYVLIYYFASTSFFWTVGNYFISRDQSSRKAGGLQNSAAGGGWKRIVSAPILGFLAGLVIVCLNIQLPDFLYQGARMLGQLTTPLALLYIGVCLHGIDWHDFHLERDIILALGGRMLASPLLMLLILQFLNIPSIMGQVFIIQSSLPVLMQVAILSAYYETDPEFGSIMVAISTICCALTIPIYMTII